MVQPATQRVPATCERRGADDSAAAAKRERRGSKTFQKPSATFPKAKARKRQRVRPTRAAIAWQDRSGPRSSEQYRLMSTAC